jgi:glycosyltransferase involved in cell wall biosynthesis
MATSSTPQVSDFTREVLSGPAEILEHERAGWLLPARNVEALACTLLQFVEKPSLRRDRGTAAAEEVHRKWL